MKGITDMAKEKKAKAEKTKQAQEEKVNAEKIETAEPEKKEDAELEKIRGELDEKNDQYLRLAAEYDNFRKRSQKEKEALYADCKSSVISELLAVIDNFERCVDFNENTSFEDYRKGVEMTYKQFLSALSKLGIESFGAEGETFDPNLHNAVMHEENDSLPENTISKVLMKGYKTGDKIIRAAVVAVAN